MNNKHDVVIIGSGIAGLSAAIYTGRGGYSTLVVRGDEPGGQLTLTTDVANYPGFPEGIGGHELVNRMESQAERFGAEFNHGIVDEISRTEDDSFEITYVDGEAQYAQSVIVASGASARTLSIPGEDLLMGHGVSTCATCDGAFHRDEEIAIVGGGDAACEEAHFLTKFASTVHLIHRRDEFRAESYWEEKVREKVDDGDINLVLNTEVTEVHGSQEDGVSGISTVHHPDGQPTDKPDSEVDSDGLDVTALFIAIGHTPNTEFLESLDVELDDVGYVNTSDSTDAFTATGEDGIFAAGDVVDNRYQQAATAGGMGVKAALDVDEFLS